MKRLTAWILTAALLLGMIPFAGAAFDDTEKIADERRQAVAIMSEKSVIAGFPDGTFKPNEPLTRAQAAKIVCVMYEGADKADALTKTDTGFSDVPSTHWAAKYIAWCVEKRIVAGVGDGKFNPDGILSGAAFAKMLVIAFTRTDAQTLEGENWVVETQRALLPEIPKDEAKVKDEPITREDACYLAYYYMKIKEPVYELSQYTVAAAKKPETVQRPKETDYADANGRLDWQTYNAAQEKWHESGSARLKDTELYRGKLDGFLTKSIPVFLGGKTGENSVYSPLNVYLALAMLAETAGSNSRAQLLNLLGAADTEELRKISKALWNANYIDDGVSESLLASSMWLNDEIEFVQPTMDLLAEEYFASSFRGKMGSKEFNDALHAWMNENTGGLLQDQVNGINMDIDTLLTLVTTIYLKAPWAESFSKSGTKPDTFHAKSGDLTCDFLHGKAEGTVWRDKRFTAAAKDLNLGVGAGAMWFFLPNEGVTPEELLQGGDVTSFLLPGEGAHTWESSNYTTVRLHLPKFDVDAKTDLIPGLKELGVKDVFIPVVADFTPSIKNTEELKPYVGEAQHAARVKIDEEGVEAAAFTEISILKSTAILDPTVFDFTLDRPFLFAITGADGLPLFVGVVNKPVKK